MQTRRVFIRNGLVLAGAMGWAGCGRTNADSTPQTSKEGSIVKVKVFNKNGELVGPIEQPKIVKAKGSKNVHSGIAHVLATFNNTIVSITDQNGSVIGWSSAGKCNFRGSRKSTAYAAQIIAQDAARNAMSHGLKDVVIRVSGPGLGRDSAIRALQAIGLEVTSITDVTPVPHNGCRPRKQRRV